MIASVLSLESRDVVVFRPEPIDEMFLRPETWLDIRRHAAKPFVNSRRVGTLAGVLSAGHPVTALTSSLGKTEESLYCLKFRLGSVWA